MLMLCFVVMTLSRYYGVNDPVAEAMMKRVVSLEVARLGWHRPPA